MSGRSCRPLFFCLLSGLALVSSATAQVVLKPNGQAGIPLRARALAADVTLREQFAETVLTLTYRNEASDRIEADFLYTLPPDTLVTGFSYWFGEERVDAQVVEKEEASAIYSHITTRMRDPALIEMVGKHAFRARIFPVMGSADLKVEMKLVQVLPSNADGFTYELPLRQEKGDALDSVDVKVRVLESPAVRKVFNNLGLPVTDGEDGAELRLTGSNYRPQKDLRVQLARDPRPLHAALYAAPSGGQDGFFALVLTPDRGLEKPVVRIDGVSTYQVLPGRLLTIAAHRALALFGRYRGGGGAVVTLSGLAGSARRAYTAPVSFGGPAEPNNLASKLWAARRIEQVGERRGGRGAAIALSKRFTLPGKFTSWLAVPREEMERYRGEKLQAQVEVCARQLAAETLAGRARSAPARRLRQQLEELCRRADQDPREALMSAVRAKLDSRIDQTAQRLAAKLLAGPGEPRTTRRLRAELEALCRRTGETTEYRVPYNLSHHIRFLTEELASEKYSEHPDRTKLGRLRGELDRLTRGFGFSADSYIRNAEYSYGSRKLEETRDRLLAEQSRPDPDPETVERLKRTFLGFARTTRNEDYGRRRLERLLNQAELARVIQWIADTPTPARRAELEQRRDELARRAEELRARTGDPLLSIQAPPDARQVVALMPDGEVKRLEYEPDQDRWQARFDIPAYAAEGEYRITVLILLKDGTRQRLMVRYHVDLTPPDGVGRAALVPGAERVLRLEMETGEDTARVAALLPWGEQVVLKRTGAGRFFALTPVPPAYQGAAAAVTWLLTDRAHNRTAITLDPGK